jgi:hypothetical protein
VVFARALCISRDPAVRRTVEAALAHVGVTVEHGDALPADAGELALLVIDRATRQSAGEALRGVRAPVVVVGDDLEDDGLFTLMLEAPVSHLLADPGDRDLGVTSAKLVSGDLFGLEKYVAPDTPVGERIVASVADRRAAMGEVCAWAEARGVRSPVVHRLANVVDETLMNALREGERRVVLRWACDDRVLAVSAGDELGAICKRDVVDHLRRARAERGRPQAAVKETDGAGIGLYLVVANVSSLVINVEPGRRTEVLCLFDLATTGRRAVASRARSLHVFSALG